MIIAIVQCGSAKAPGACAAERMYIGSLFVALARAARRIANRWYIASAKYGLLLPSSVIQPYDATLPDGGDLAWGARIRASLMELEPRGWDELVALCSRRYLVGWAHELGASAPLAGLPIGRMIKAANGLRRSDGQGDSFA